MMETKTKIREVFVDILCLQYFSPAGHNLPRKCACCSADSSAYCILCDWYDRIYFGV